MSHEFKAEATGGWESAEYSQDYSPPPRSSKLVAEVSWSWSPAHSRWSKFWLCTDQRRSGWYLYEEDSDYDSGKPLYACVAMGMPYRKIDAKYAAEELLLTAWKEQAKYEDEFSIPNIEKLGLLDTEDIKRIGQLVLGSVDNPDN